MNPQTVFIIVKSGLVASVYGTDRINIEIVDLDNNDDQDVADEAARRDEELQKLVIEGKLQVLN
jgi:hypothetical protein